MDKKQEAQRLADEAKAKLGNPDATPISNSTVRPDNVPVDQSDMRDVVERQIKTQEEAERQERDAVASAVVNDLQQAIDAAAADDQPAKGRKSKKDEPRLVEVQVVKKYVPHFIEDENGELARNTGVTQTVPAGTTLRLPEAEATRALQMGIAVATANTLKG